MLLEPSALCLSERVVAAEGSRESHQGPERRFCAWLEIGVHPANALAVSDRKDVRLEEALEHRRDQLELSHIGGRIAIDRGRHLRRYPRRSLRRLINVTARYRSRQQR